MSLILINTTRNADGDPIRNEVETLEKYQLNFQKRIAFDAFGNGYFLDAILVIGKRLKAGDILKFVDYDNSERYYKIINESEPRTGRNVYSLASEELKV